MTQTQFEQLYNARREQEIKVGFFKKTFPLMKSKITKKAVYKDVLSESGVPSRVLVTPAISKKVVDTNKIGELYQAMWEYFIGTKLMRFSSEGRYRPAYTDSNGVYHEAKRLSLPHKGHSDFANGRYYIEEKSKDEYHLDSQVEFADWVRGNGDVYVTVRCFDDMMCVINAVLAKDDSMMSHLFAMKVKKTRVDNSPLFELK